MYIGPYKTLVGRGRAGRQLEDMKVPFTETEESQGRVRGYRVYQGPFADALETSSARRRLERQGIKDLYLVKEGKQQFISLGFFSSQKSAAEFTRELSQKKVVTKQRTEYEANYWLIISDPDAMEKLQKKNAFPLPGGVSKEIRNCK
jgi:heme-degrading monooxygenase HmoA